MSILFIVHIHMCVEIIIITKEITLSPLYIVAANPAPPADWLLDLNTSRDPPGMRGFELFNPFVQ